MECEIVKKCTFIVCDKRQKQGKKDDQVFEDPLDDEPCDRNFTCGANISFRWSLHN